MMKANADKIGDDVKGNISPGGGSSLYLLSKSYTTVLLYVMVV